MPPLRRKANNFKETGVAVAVSALGVFGMGTRIESQRGDPPATTLVAARQPNEEARSIRNPRSCAGKGR